MIFLQAYRSVTNLSGPRASEARSVENQNDPVACAEGSRRVFILGAFDLDNYGDLLFPLIAAHRLARDRFEVVPVAPTATPTRFVDAMPQLDVTHLLTGTEPAAGILIGGGWIIHNLPIDVVKVYGDAGVGRWAGVGFWFAGVLAGALRDIPVIWNAPGVPNPFSRSKLAGVVEPAVAASDYIAVRERSSAQLLTTQDPERIEIVPDTAVDVSAMWPRADLERRLPGLAERFGFRPDQSYALIHLRRSLGPGGAADLARQIDRFADEHGLFPLLVSISHAMNDADLIAEVSGRLGCRHGVLVDPTSIQDVAALLACCRIYLGVSLHAYITAAAYDVPGLIVARSPHRRLSGFLEHTGHRRDMVRDWEQAFVEAARLLAEPPTPRIPASVREQLDAHWARVVSVLGDPVRGAPARHDFLVRYLRYGIKTEGPGWALEAAVTRGTPVDPAAVLAMRRAASGASQ